MDLLERAKQQLAKQQLVEQKPKVEKSEAKTRKKPKVSKIKSDISKLTIDELRAYYIVICKKIPKHDSKQNKSFLANEIIKVLNLSKKVM